ncbi:MAG: DUF3240 family protein [Giesbergeria sp.]|uniref:DUF3240 family protein n=1 Tax=Giesbergeria sp. TaxID=2818473 RepID=UPI0026156133|nr:DUF3240 family protein [Giesbergeria sp.]MDD2610171.1 DUF3240 family protein [Giesbergeria sp.]
MSLSTPTKTPPDCLLTLALPQSLEEEMLDLLLSHPDMAPGFTVVQGQGVGRHIQLASGMEQVQGRARRIIVQVALAQAQLPSLLAILRHELPSPQIAYWVVPLLAFGRLGVSA